MTSRSSVTGRRLGSHEVILAVVTVLVVGGIWILSPEFRNPDNLLTQLRFMSELGFIALAMTLVILSGGIDLSVGAIFGLVCIAFGKFWQDAGLPLALAACCGLLVGVLAGAVNGFTVRLTGMPPFIVTIGTLALFRGVAEGLSQNRSVSGFPEWFQFLGSGYVFGIPVQLLLFVVLTVVFGVLVMRTVFGRSIYAIGSNEDASFFSGVQVGPTRVWIYVLSGFMSGLAAVIYVSRVTTTRADMGLGMELDAITAVVLGGTSIFGGKGTIVGTVLALVLVAALKNGLTLLGVRGDGTVVVIGAVLVVTLLISNFLGEARRT